MQLTNTMKQRGRLETKWKSNEQYRMIIMNVRKFLYLGICQVYTDSITTYMYVKYTELGSVWCIENGLVNNRRDVSFAQLHFFH